MDTIYSFPVFSTCDSNFYQSQKEIKLGWATAVLCSREREREQPAMQRLDRRRRRRHVVLLHRRRLRVSEWGLN